MSNSRNHATPAAAPEATDKWPAYHTTASCYQDDEENGGLWWVEVYSRWTGDHLDAELLPAKEFTPKVADAVLAQLGWARKGPWRTGDPQRAACDVFANSPRPLSQDHTIRILGEELTLLERNAAQLRRQLDILTAQPDTPSPTTEQ